MSPKPCLTVADVAALTGLTDPGIRKLAAAGKIPHFRLAPKAIRFDANEIDEWLQAARRPAKIGGE